MTSKVLAILLLLVVSTVAKGSIVAIDFETSEGYPAIYPTDGTNVYLYDHGWYQGSSAWSVPYTNSTNPADAFYHTGARSAKVIAMSIQQDWCSYAAPWTPSANETTVNYSSHMAFQKYTYGGNAPGSYGGIVLRGKKANAAEVILGGIQLCSDGTVTAWGYPSGTYTAIVSSYTYALDSWYQLDIKADFGSDTVQFLLDGNPVGYGSFSSDMVELSSIALYCGSNDKWSTHFMRYDTITVDVPEPMTLAMLGLGGLGLLKRSRRA
jgi:hypothetical protein